MNFQLCLKDKILEVLEFGDKSKRKIILIHGFQSPYQVWDKYIKYFEKEFHIIVPILPGHNPKQIEDFKSFEKVAGELEEYYIPIYGKKVYAIYGMSMGGVLTATLWKRNKLSIDKLIFDGSPIVSINGFMKSMMTSFYLSITKKTQKRDKKSLEQAKKSIISEECFEPFLAVLDNMSDETIKNCIGDIASFHVTSNINSPNTEIYYYHGTAPNEMLAKKSAKYLAKHYPKVNVKCFKGRGHCELALLYPDMMIEELKQVL